MTPFWRFARRSAPVLLGTLLISWSAGAAVPRKGDYPQDYYRKPEPSALRALKMQMQLADQQLPRAMPAMTAAPCVGGTVAGFPCRNVDLESFLPLADIGGGNGNDVWGWTDPETGHEYALMGRTNGTAFVDVTDPANPIFVGDLPTTAESATWRDIKVYADHAFIVADRSRDHGMQVFDLTLLRDVFKPPVTFVPRTLYTDFATAHNLVINEATGFAYAVGSNTCAGGLHMIDIRVPQSPAFAGCYADDGYTHDAQCVIYTGPDTEHQGRELCFASNEDTLTIVDVTDKAAPVLISRTGYTNRGYTHQGWLTAAQDYFLVDDELDEWRHQITTSTHIWHVADLDAPVRIGVYAASLASIDHNLYVVGKRVFESNYRSGLRILDIDCQDAGGIGLSEIGYFDTYPDDDTLGFNGNWSNYPFFRSGVVLVSTIEHGLFVLRPNLPPGLDDSVPGIGNAVRAVRMGLDVELTVVTPPISGGLNVYRATERWLAGERLGTPPSTVTSTYTDGGAVGDGVALYFYRLRAVDDCGVEGP